jgi:hypothetical protein
MARGLHINASTAASDEGLLSLKEDNRNIIYAAKPSSPPCMENSPCPAFIHNSADTSELFPEQELEQALEQMQIIGQ